MKTEKNKYQSRREFLRNAGKLIVIAPLLAIPAFLVRKTSARGYVWQIDPFKCTQCGQCKTNCVKTPSAVKCTHAFVMCGYCDLCGAYLRQGVQTTGTGAEREQCPTGAVRRRFVEEPYFEYTINEDLCNACGKCVKGCNDFGNGSMYLQIHHDLCDNCNSCSIARSCPSQAISRVPHNHQYIPKDRNSNNNLSKPVTGKNIQMKKKFIPYIIILILLCWHTVLSAQDRFPRPEFESGYVYPTNQLPLQRAVFFDYLDVVLLIVALSVSTWLAIKKRSRQGLVWLAVFSLAYFGFVRQGCICAVGSVQNIALALFNDGYSIPLTVLLFFIIPLVFALFFGKVFCAGVCPFGAIQELTGFKTVKLPKTVESIMAAVPFIYLAAAVLFAATGNQFIICRYDPFVGIFRLNGPNTIIIFGALLLIAGIFINRPYCRYLCPYGVLLNIFSRFAGKHLSITPAECTDCRLCEDACPYDAILPSTGAATDDDQAKSRKRFIIYILLVPVFMTAGALIFYNLAPALSGISRDVQLAKEIRAEKLTGVEAVSKAAVAFKEAGKTEAELFAGEIKIISKFRKASPWAGAFLGLSLGIGLVSLTVRSSRSGYKPNQGKCYSCGRCFRYCPVEIKKNDKE